MGGLPFLPGRLVQVWADQIPLRAGEALSCPVCHGYGFTVTRREYGWELACWQHPVYIGVRIWPPREGESAMKAAWAHLVCPECGITWDTPSPDCPKVMYNRHPLAPLPANWPLPGEGGAPG